MNKLEMNKLVMHKVIERDLAFFLLSLFLSFTHT